MTPDQKQLYIRVINQYGEDAQALKAAEECSELIQAIVKLQLNPNQTRRLPELLEEMADVQIMLDQLKLIHGPRLFEHAFNKKFNRLQMSIISLENKKKGSIHN